MEVRTGKTLTSLGILNKMMSVNKALFITKKKAISSIESDFNLLKPGFELTVINYESLHKIVWVLFQNQVSELSKLRN